MLRYSHDSSGNISTLIQGSLLPPQITGQPIQQVVAPGTIVTFSVVVADTRAVSFQWKFNGTAIPGATGDSLLLSNISAANEGQYSVVVTNSAGTVTSAPAALLLDSDRDGLPDSWELANFGSLTSQSGAGDPDGDGLSNSEEFSDGTNPNSNASLRPRLVAYSDAGGSVSANPLKLSYEQGELVTLTATPVPPSAFIGWARDLATGDLVSTSNPVTFALNGNKTVRARFATALPIPPGLVAFWRGQADASDLLGRHSGGFFVGKTPAPASVTQSGKVGGCFLFDGSVYVQIPDAPELRPAQITVEAWVFPTLLTGTDQVIIASGSQTSEYDAWALSLANGKPRFWSNHVGPGMVMLEAPSAIPYSAWTHLAISFDGSTRYLYINGVQVAAQGGLGGLIYESGVVPVTIGSDWAYNASSSRLHGRVAEVALYNRALTLNEVNDSYQADSAGKNVYSPYFASPSILPTTTAGAAYSQVLTTVLGKPPIVFSLTRGALPTGMTLSTAGTVSGVASTPGTFDFTVLATDAAGNSTEQLCILRVPQSIALPADMLAWWRGEPDARSVATDSVGSHDGTFYKGIVAATPSYAPGGKVGSALAFDGTNHIRVPSTADLRPSQVTVEGWVFPTVLNGNHQTFFASGSSTSDDDTWLGCVYNGKLGFCTKHVDAGNQYLEAPVAIPINQWSHLAMTFDGATKLIYLNGVAVASQQGLGALVYDPAAVPVTIGADWAANAPSSLFTGRIDELSLYRRALTPDEIFRIADTGAAGKNTAGPYITTPSQLPFAIANKTFSYAFTSSRGTGTVGYALTTNSTLPTGLTLTSAGLLSGVPTSRGNFAFRVRATDGTGLPYEQSCTLQVFDSVAAPAGMIGWWRAEGDARDAIGTNHGTLRNSASFVGGQVGQAFSLNGIDGSVEIPDAPALRLVSLTVEAWVAFDSTTGVRAIVAKPVGTGTSDSFALWLQNGILFGAVSDSANSGLVLNSSYSLAGGRFYHVAFSFDSGTKQQAIYVNGVQVAVGTTSVVIGYDAQPLLLGRDTERGVPSFFMQGRIDEAAIYNRALSLSELTSIYIAGPAGKRTS